MVKDATIASSVAVKNAGFPAAGNSTTQLHALLSTERHSNLRCALSNSIHSLVGALGVVGQFSICSQGYGPYHMVFWKWKVTLKEWSLFKFSGCHLKPL